MNYIILVMLIMIIIKDYSLYIRRLKIPTNKGANEITIVVCAETFIIILTLVLAKVWIHYLFGILCCFIILISFMEQGITEYGILTVSKRKSLYKFSEMERAEVILYSNIIEVIYYGRSDVKIIKQRFDKDNLFKILGVFKSNKLRFSYKE